MEKKKKLADSIGAKLIIIDRVDDETYDLLRGLLVSIINNK